MNNNEPLPPVLQAVQDYMNASDMMDLRAILNQRGSLLLTDEAEGICTHIVDNVPPNTPDDVRGRLRRNRDILRLCRVHGVDEGLRRFMDAAFENLPPMLKAVKDYMNAANLDEARALLTRHASLLLTQEAEEVCSKIADNVPDSMPAQLAARLTHNRDVLRLCRAHGIEEGVRRFVQQKRDDLPPVMAAMQDLLNATDLDAIRAVLTRHAALLLTEEGENVCVQIVDNAPPGMGSDFMERVTRNRDIVRLCRQYGLDEGLRRYRESTGGGFDDGLQNLRNFLANPPGSHR